MMTTTGITSTSDRYGKIMGRFETRVSLESTDPAYISYRSASWKRIRKG
ncbi:MAG: hypothetical protein WCZ43_07120 [Proteiniphilum sp.]